jgi:hypothetical protein
LVTFSHGVKIPILELLVSALLKRVFCSRKAIMVVTIGRRHHGVLVVIEGAADRTEQTALVQVLSEPFEGLSLGGHRERAGAPSMATRGGVVEITRILRGFFWVRLWSRQEILEKLFAHDVQLPEETAAEQES